MTTYVTEENQKMHTIARNYPSKGGVSELAAWFRDSEGDLLGIGQPLR